MTVTAEELQALRFRLYEQRLDRFAFELPRYSDQLREAGGKMREQAVDVFTDTTKWRDRYKPGADLNARIAQRVEAGLNRNREVRDGIVVNVEKQIAQLNAAIDAVGSEMGGTTAQMRQDARRALLEMPPMTRDGFVERNASENTLRAIREFPAEFGLVSDKALKAAIRRIAAENDPERAALLNDLTAYVAAIRDLHDAVVRAIHEFAPNAAATPA